MIRRIAASALVAGMVLAATTANATLIGPVYPAPGGNAFSQSGSSAGSSGGVTNSYSGFDTGAFSALYWGPQWGSDGPQATLDGTLHDLAFLGISGTTAIWQGTTSYTSPGGPGALSPCASCPIRFVVDITGLGANPWVTERSVAGLSALAPGIGAVVDDSSGADFSANLQFQADLGGGFVAINGVLQGAPGGQTGSSVSGAFYSAPVPEPGTLAMLLAGVASLSAWARRRA
jgi:hypothetical protein